MGKAFINKLYNEKFMQLHASDQTSKQRNTLESKLGQLLKLNDIKGFEEVFEAHNIKLEPLELQEVFAAGLLEASKLHKAFVARYPIIARRYKTAFIKDGIITDVEFGRTAFLIKHFSKPSKGKDAFQNIDTVKAAMLKVAEGINSDVTANKDSIQRQINKGHGDEGLAVSEVRVIQGLNQLSSMIDKKTFDNLMQEAIVDFAAQDSLLPLEAIKNLTTRYSQVVTKKGSLKASYTSVITFQSYESNQEDRYREVRLKNFFYNKFVPVMIDKIVDLKGSSTLKQKVMSTIVSNAIPKKGKPKVKLDKKLLTKDLATAGVATITPTNEKDKKATKSRPKKTTLNLKRSKDSTINLRSLIPVINTRLADVVARNMGSPGLNYRTGRFAHSSKVVDITRTHMGYPSIAYTYMRNPYQVFEYPGGNPNLASSDRDPRSVLSKSIREIAIGLIDQRFYTRRV